MNGDKPTLQESFNALAAVYPQLTAGQQPLGAGVFGIVIASRDIPPGGVPTVTKILYRHENPEMRAAAETALRNEVLLLKLLDGGTAEIQTPVLIAAPQRLDDPQYIASYTMTRIAGAPVNWVFTADDDPVARAHHFREMGGALAKFHALAAGLPGVDALAAWDWGGKIETVAGLDEATNKELAAADRYLQAHKVPGIAHGDYHDGNVLRDAQGNVTGMIDFSNVGPSSNILVDFPWQLTDAIDDFIGGYEAAGGVKIDKNAGLMTEISGQVNYLKGVYADEEKRDSALRHLRRTLDKARPVTAGL